MNCSFYYISMLRKHLIMTPYLICKFEKQTLSNLIKECFDSKFPDVYNKIQIDYISILERHKMQISFA
ncbi:hypothetical protein BANRA_01845 [Escherichia coli]|nr:hypothetical protein BANRA_01845 [Escherichia coli]